jgi:hypothetical protein
VRHPGIYTPGAARNVTSVLIYPIDIEYRKSIAVVRNTKVVPFVISERRAVRVIVNAAPSCNVPVPLPGAAAIGYNIAGITAAVSILVRNERRVT